MTPSLANNSSHVIVGGVHADHLTRQTLQLPGKTFPENWIFIFITHYLCRGITYILIINTGMAEIGYHYTHITLTPHDIITQCASHYITCKGICDPPPQGDPIFHQSHIPKYRLLPP